MTIHSWVLRQRGQIEKVLVYSGGWHETCLPQETIDGQNYLVFRVRLLRQLRPITIEAATELFDSQEEDLGFCAELSVQKTEERKNRDMNGRPPKNGTMLTGKEMHLYFKEQPRPTEDFLRIPNRYNESL